MGKTYIISTKINSTGWNDYRVRLYVNGIHQIEADYFSSDRDDADETAMDMKNRLAEKFNNGRNKVIIIDP